MTVLHELLAVEKDAAALATKVTDEAAITFSKKPDHFRGHVTAVSYFDEKRQSENVSESKEIVTSVDDKLGYVNSALVRLWDVYYQRDVTNMSAKADIVVDNVTLAKDVPGVFLLMMETRLAHYRSLIETIPTLEPAIAWVDDPSRGKDVFRSPVRTNMRTEKILDHKILVAATDKHPAQVEKWTADVNVARVDTTHFSAMWSVAKKSEVLGRVDKLIAAVKMARMRANLVEVPKANVARALTDFIMGTTSK